MSEDKEPVLTMTEEERQEVVNAVNSGVEMAKAKGVNCGYPLSVEIDGYTIINKKALTHRTLRNNQLNKEHEL